jgi:heme oxygenase
MSKAEIVFDADRLYAGLVYHLLAKGIADHVDTESLEYHRDRHQHVYTALRSDWRIATDDQRLKWIYAHVNCTAQLGDDNQIIFGPR